MLLTQSGAVFYCWSARRAASILGIRVVGIIDFSVPELEIGLETLCGLFACHRRKIGTRSNQPLVVPPRGEPVAYARLSRIPRCSPEQPNQKLPHHAEVRFLEVPALDAEQSPSTSCAEVGRQV